KIIETDLIKGIGNYNNIEDTFSKQKILQESANESIVKLENILKERENKILDKNIKPLKAFNHFADAEYQTDILGSMSRINEMLALQENEVYKAQKKINDDFFSNMDESDLQNPDIGIIKEIINNTNQIINLELRALHLVKLTRIIL